MDIESHTFIATSEEFGPTLEDVAALTCLPMFGESHVEDLALVEKDKKKLEFLNKV